MSKLTNLYKKYSILEHNDVPVSERLLLDTIKSKSFLLLDVGCGKGKKGEKLKDKCKIIGIDIGHHRVKMAKNKIPTLISDAENLPFKNEKYDGIISFQSIEHLNNRLKFLRESYRILKRNGFLLITTPNRNRIPPVFINILLRNIKKQKYPMNHDHTLELSKRDILNLCEKAGFTETKVFPIHYKLNLFKRELHMSLIPDEYCDQLVSVSYK